MIQETTKKKKKKDLFSCHTVNILLMTVTQAGHKYANNNSAQRRYAKEKLKNISYQTSKQQRILISLLSAKNKTVNLE